MTLSQAQPLCEDRARDGERRSIRVLLIDADPADTAKLCQMLDDSRQIAFVVRTASTLPQGSQLLTDQRFDAVLLDLHLPGSRGLSALDELHAIAPGIPVIVVTASHRDSEALEVVRSGAQEYLVKSRLNATATERILLYCVERQRGIRRNAAQTAVSRVLAESETLECAQTGLLRVLGEFCECDHGEFWKVDPASSELVQAQTWASRSGGARLAGFEPSKVHRGVGLPGRAWISGVPEWLDDLAHNQDIPQCRAAVAAGFRSALAFPVKLGAETLGVVELFSRGAIDTDDDVLQLLMNAGGQLGQFMARQAAEQEKERLTRERLLILDCASEGIYGVDLQGCVSFMNRSAAAMLQCKPADVLGKNSHELFCQPRTEKVSHLPEQCPILRTIRTGKAVRLERREIRRLNNSIFDAEYSVFPLSEGGQTKGAVICFSDTTERKRMEVELRHAQKLEAVGALAAGIAHEINTPIQFIGDNSRFLQDAFRGVAKMIATYEESCSAARNGALSKETFDLLAAERAAADWTYLETEIPKALDQTLDGVGRVAKIVRGMKDFSHVDRSSEQTAADINKALESTLIVAHNELKYVADVQTLYGELPPVICHLGDLNQVFLNLLINAAHAIGDAMKDSGTKGRIHVRTHRDGDWVEIAISDTGMGVPKAVREKIFDPFFTTKGVGKGTGQGLALARAVVVERHRGTLNFASEIGRGTTFFVRLPIAGAAATHEASRP